MTSTEILEAITSGDRHQVWKAACTIVELSQDNRIIAPLTEHLDLIIEKTRDVKLGGAIAPNQRFLDAAIKTLRFHQTAGKCPCALFGVHNCMDPNRQAANGYLTIEDFTRIDGKWIDTYFASCTRCGQRFEIKEREGHYTWWAWKRVDG